MTMIIITKR